MGKIGQIWWAPNFLGCSAALLSALQGCSHLLLPLLGPTTPALANLKLGKTRRFSKMLQPVEFSDKKYHESWYKLFLPIQAVPDKSASPKSQNRSFVSTCSCWHVILTWNILKHPCLRPRMSSVASSSPSESSSCQHESVKSSKAFKSGQNSIITRPQQVEDQRVQDSLLKARSLKTQSRIMYCQDMSRYVQNPSLVRHCFSGRQNERENHPRRTPPTPRQKSHEIALERFRKYVSPSQSSSLWLSLFDSSSSTAYGIEIAQRITKAYANEMTYRNLKVTTTPNVMSLCMCSHTFKVTFTYLSSLYILWISLVANWPGARNSLERNTRTESNRLRIRGVERVAAWCDHDEGLWQFHIEWPLVVQAYFVIKIAIIRKKRGES